jgi:hypothetical protein
MIERGLAEESVGRRLAHLKGALRERVSSSDALTRAIRERNWRS